MEARERRILHYVTHDGRDLFQIWIDDLKDTTGRAVILKRIARVKEGNFGDHGTVSGGVSELRIHYGPGYRVYYGESGPVIVLLLCGGDKDSQQRDIRKAQEVWVAYKRKK